MTTVVQRRSSGRIPKAGVGEFVPPADVLLDVFPPSVRQAWRANATEGLIRRLEILCACGPYPDNPRRASGLRYNHAYRAAWEAYLFTSFACGLFEARGDDLRQRLASTHEDDFRGAMAECMICWFLAGKQKLPLLADAPGRNGHNLDMQVIIAGQGVGVEVKAPFRELPKERFWWGDDSDKISEVMNTANKQFAKDCPNILALAPELRRPCYSHRHDLIKAAFGESMITWPVNTQTGEGGPTEIKFFQNGRFLKSQKSKPDGFPGYRRISAILCIEESVIDRYPFPDPTLLLPEETRSQLGPLWEQARDRHFSPENRAWVDHNVLVLHNPHAYHPISHDLFAEYPQLVPVDDHMEWTDGEEVIV